MLLAGEWPLMCKIIIVQRSLPGGHAVAAAMHEKLAYDTLDDFSFISLVTQVPDVWRCGDFGSYQRDWLLTPAP